MASRAHPASQGAARALAVSHLHHPPLPSLPPPPCCGSRPRRRGRERLPGHPWARARPPARGPLCSWKSIKSSLAQHRLQHFVGHGGGAPASAPDLWGPAWPGHETAWGPRGPPPDGKRSTCRRQRGNQVGASPALRPAPAAGMQTSRRGREGKGTARLGRAGGEEPEPEPVCPRGPSARVRGPAMGRPAGSAALPAPLLLLPLLLAAAPRPDPAAPRLRVAANFVRSRWGGAGSGQAGVRARPGPTGCNGPGLSRRRARELGARCPGLRLLLDSSQGGARRGEPRGRRCLPGAELVPCPCVSPPAVARPQAAGLPGPGPELAPAAGPA